MLPLPHPSSLLAVTKGTGPGSREGHNPVSVSHHLFKYSPSPPCSPPVISTHQASPSPYLSPWFETHFWFCSDNYFPLPADAQVKSTTWHRKKKKKPKNWSLGHLGRWGWRTSQWHQEPLGLQKFSAESTRKPHRRHSLSFETRQTGF